MEFILDEQSTGKFLFQVITEGALHYFYLNEQEVTNLRNMKINFASGKIER